MISEQRKCFIDEYLRLRCKNAKQAAIKAGYSEKSAQSQSSQLLKNDNVLEYLNQQKSKLISDLQQEFIFDALEARKVMRTILDDVEAEDKDRINVAKDFLDRAGFKPTDKVDISADLDLNISLDYGNGD